MAGSAEKSVNVEYRIDALGRGDGMAASWGRSRRSDGTMEILFSNGNRSTGPYFFLSSRAQFVEHREVVLDRQACEARKARAHSQFPRFILAHRGADSCAAMR